MKIKFRDNYGTKETLYFNPELVIYPDGSVLALPTTVYVSGKGFDIPAYAGEIRELWCDPKRNTYNSSERHNEPGAFKVSWVKDGVVYISRYKEQPAEETIIQKMLRRIKGLI